MRCASARVVCLGALAIVAASPGRAANPAAPQAGAGQAAAAAPLGGASVAAVWKTRHIDFVYRGRTARYSCEGLRDKVRAMLLDLGARRDMKIVATGCEADDRLRVNSPQPGLDIVFSAPALQDGAARPPGVGDPAATDARFEAFTIAGDAFRDMGIGDCELVQEFARQILPTLATRDVRRDITCVPTQPSESRFLVRGKVLKTLVQAGQATDRRHGAR